MFLETAGTMPGKERVSRDGQRETLSCDDVVIVASADPIVSSGAGPTFQRCHKQPVWTRHWMWAYSGEGVSLYPRQFPCRGWCVVLAC